MVIAESSGKFGPEFRKGWGADRPENGNANRARIARDLGINPGILGNWVAKKDHAERKGTQWLSAEKSRS